MSKYAVQYLRRIIWSTCSLVCNSEPIEKIDCGMRIHLFGERIELGFAGSYDDAYRLVVLADSYV